MNTPDIAPEVLMFIGRFSTDGRNVRQQVVDCFTCGCCYWFARILEERFHSQYKTAIVVDYVANHFATMIGDRVYDITGDVTDGYNWQPWDDWTACKDATTYKRIVEDCIMF